MGMGIRAEADLLLGAEGRPGGGREQARALGPLGEELARHAEVDDQPAPVVEPRHQVLAVALEHPDGAARETTPELRRGGEEEVARPRGRDPPDRAADQDRGDPSPGHLHFGQLGHGVWAV